MIQCDECGEADSTQFYAYMLKRANGYCLCKQCAWKERRVAKRVHDIDCSCMICSRVQLTPTPSPEKIKDSIQAWQDLRQQQMEKWKHQHEQMAALLAEHPDMNASELGRCVGCSRETARNWKRRFQQKEQEV